ncbi:hypothetical protein [Chitinophaga rhizophila]|uniref:Uncharacterized protein n=1 Tax=Chitinophaga rhizophila TaxID=2866212 RepID=A0ABS7GHF3_9BACT|nr:hypothetical protein [Chitinophaga rhizophila]MBW8687108.1 hypothetical protein [Chitinophaga rhizophila]
MKTPDELEAYIKQLLITNHLDINIQLYPELISAGKELGYDMNGLAAIAGRIYESTDWRPYKTIDQLVMSNPSFVQGRFFNADAKRIIEKVKDDLTPAEATAYIISIISREPHNFRPRLHPAPDIGSFRDPWMTDSAWELYRVQAPPVEWCGMEAITTEQLGEILFNRKEETYPLLQHKSYLTSTVTLLTRSAAIAYSFEKIFEEEKDMERRYLTIVYRLNNELPFPFRGRMPATLTDLLTAGCSSQAAFKQLEGIYSKGHIHIWQREAQSSVAAHLPASLNRSGFLELLYQVNPNYPFYLFGEAYTSPAHLVTATRTNGALWQYVYQAIADKHLYIWLTAQGYLSLVAQLEKKIATLHTSALYIEEDRKLAVVQAFINLLDESSPVPGIIATPAALSLNNIEVSEVMSTAITFQLATDGFVKAAVRLQPELPGVSLDKSVIKFFGLTDNRQCELRLAIDPIYLQKDTAYTFDIVVNSIHEEMRVPVALCLVFPRRAYINHMYQWGLTGAIFFLMIGLFGLAIDDRTTYEVATAQYLPLDVSSGYLPGFSVGYLFLLLLLIGGIAGAFWYIKKQYKLNIYD